MDKFATLEPVRLYSSSTEQKSIKPVLSQPLVGRLPSDIHLLVLAHLPLPDFPAYTRASRSTAALAHTDSLWQSRATHLQLHLPQVSAVLNDIEKEKKPAVARASAPAPTDDDFGDFAEGDLGSPPMEDEMGDFVGAFNNILQPQSLSFSVSLTKQLPDSSWRAKFIRAHSLLKPLLKYLASPSHSILSFLSNASLSHSARTLRLLSLYLSPFIQPTLNWAVLASLLRTAMDRFDATLLAAFDTADSKGDEDAMRQAAEASWEVWDRRGDWEMGKVWAEKREIFYETARWRPLDNFTLDGGLDFEAMDVFIGVILDAIAEHGTRAVRVFPPDSHVLISFAERLANEVVGEYITTLVTRARELSTATYLTAAAASFREAWRIVDAIVQAAKAGDPSPNTKNNGTMKDTSKITLTMAEDVVYQMFETNMDEYLDEEVDSVKLAFDTICKTWERQMITTTTTTTTTPASAQATTQTSLSTPIQPQGSLSPSSSSTTTRFLASHNPALVKRNFLASFTSVLLLPVTIVPRVGGAVGGAVTGGIAMLNPQRWGGGAGSGSGGSGSGGSGGGSGSGGGFKSGLSTNLGLSNAHGAAGYTRDLDKDSGMLFEVGEEEEEEEVQDEKKDDRAVFEAREEENAWGNDDETGRRRTSVVSSSLQVPFPGSGAVTPTTPGSGTATPTNTAPASTTTPTATTTSTATDTFDLLLSLDVALELIHADREALKRVETFAGYPGHYGHRVRDTIEELFILFLQAASERHMRRGFGEATARMMAYKPAEHGDTTSVAPLLQFFELVHVGDTIQSMVQVYFDKELAHHIDKTDFLNAVVREKKRFENTLDDSVAAGLNAGTDVLMNQVEHIILTLTKPREYYPPEDTPLDLGPTRGCTEAIRCLEMHCKLLKGSTSKEVLEVFYQEIGIRLIAILQKHIKRQIISLSGGFQVIADLNTYHAFISSLKVPSITADFSHLKMLGHVYVVEDAKDLAQIVRDVTRYGGAYRPEDVYEFIQRRSDWKKIEKVVDKTMYNLSFKEDCVVC